MLGFFLHYPKWLESIPADLFNVAPIILVHGRSNTSCLFNEIDSQPAQLSSDKQVINKKNTPVALLNIFWEELVAF
jgi:hypothetical protein